MNYQFEAIRPFRTDNGGKSRTVNISYLTHKILPDSPILFLTGLLSVSK